MAVTLRSAVGDDVESIAHILIAVRSAFMSYAPLMHSPEEVRSWVSESLVPSNETVIAESDGKLVGVMAMEREGEGFCSWISQMAVSPDHVGMGIGSVLLEHAFRVLPAPIRLFTFQANTGARRFYERHGFRIVRLSDGGANEERYPDALYEFSTSVQTSA